MNNKLTTWVLLSIIIVAGIINYTVDQHLSRKLTNETIAGVLDWARNDYEEMLEQNAFHKLDSINTLYTLSVHLQKNLSLLLEDENYPWLQNGTALSVYLMKVEKDGKIDDHEQQVLQKLFLLYDQMPAFQAEVLDPETSKINPKVLEKLIELDQQIRAIINKETHPVQTQAHRTFLVGFVI